MMLLSILNVAPNYTSRSSCRTVFRFSISSFARIISQCVQKSMNSHFDRALQYQYAVLTLCLKPNNSHFEISEMARGHQLIRFYVGSEYCHYPLRNTVTLLLCLRHQIVQCVQKMLNILSLPKQHHVESNVLFSRIHSRSGKTTRGRTTNQTLLHFLQ